MTKEPSCGLVSYMIDIILAVQHNHRLRGPGCVRVCGSVGSEIHFLSLKNQSDARSGCVWRSDVHLGALQSPPLNCHCCQTLTSMKILASPQSSHSLEHMHVRINTYACTYVLGDNRGIIVKRCRVWWYCSTCKASRVSGPVACVSTWRTSTPFACHLAMGPLNHGLTEALHLMPCQIAWTGLIINYNHAYFAITLISPRHRPWINFSHPQNS